MTDSIHKSWFEPRMTEAASDETLQQPLRERAQALLQRYPRTAQLEALLTHEGATLPSKWGEALNDGWDEPVADALTSLLGLERASDTAIRIRQIKEKMGVLRIYVAVDEDSVGPFGIVKSTPASTNFRNSAKPGSVRKHAHKIVDQAADRAELYCIRCGAPATHRSGLYRVCATHVQREGSRT